MKRDPYKSSAKKYDLFIEPLTRDLRYFFEIAAGHEHFKNFRSFIRNKGIPGLILLHKLILDKMKITGDGNFGFYLLKRKNII